MTICFHAGAIEHKRKLGSLGNAALSKAIGAPKKGRIVFDVTAGLGRDAYAMAYWGCQVTAIERVSEIFVELEQARHEACQFSSAHRRLFERLKFIHDDSKKF